MCHLNCSNKVHSYKYNTFCIVHLDQELKSTILKLNFETVPNYTTEQTLLSKDTDQVSEGCLKQSKVQQRYLPPCYACPTLGLWPTSHVLVFINVTSLTLLLCLGNTSGIDLGGSRCRYGLIQTHFQTRCIY